MKLVYFLTLITYIFTSSITTPDNIIEWLKENTTRYDRDNLTCYIITNSDAYINSNQYDILYDLMKEAQQNYNFSYILTVVDRIPQVSEPAKVFAEDLQELMAKENFTEHQRSIVMVFSIGDREFSIEAGYDALKVFDGNRAKRYLEIISTKLSKGNYFEAFEQLLRYYKNNYVPPSDSSSGSNILSTLAVIGLILVIIILRVVCKYVCGCECQSSSSYSYSSHRYHHHSSGGKRSGGRVKSHGSGASGRW